MTAAQELDVPAPLVTPEEPTGLLGRFRKMSGLFTWGLFAFFCLLFFTLVRIPNTKIESWVQGMMSSQLASQGIVMHAEKSSLSFLFGLTYVMKDVQIQIPGSETPLKVERVSFSPSLLPLFIGRFGASLEIQDRDSVLDIGFSSAVSGKSLSLSCRAKRFDVGKIGILSLAAGIKGGAIVNGSLDFSGDLTTPTSVSGDVRLALSKINLDEQMISMFKIPKLAISEGQMDIQIKNGRATIKTLTLGKAGNTNEDIRGTVTGDLTLGRQLEQSSANLKIRFGVSDNAMKAFPYLDALLSQGKQPDGMYLYQLSGPLYGPTWAPTSP